MYVSIYVLRQMCSTVVLNLRMSTLRVRNPSFKTKKEDPSSILQSNCTSNRFARRISFGLCPAVFTVQFTLALAEQSKMSVVCASCYLDPPGTLRGVHCPGVDYIHYAKSPFFILVHHRSGGASNHLHLCQMSAFGKVVGGGEGRAEDSQNENGLVN